MTTYRSAPNPRPPTIIQVKRSLLTAFIVLVLAMPFAVLSSVFSRSELTCSRTTNECRVRVITGPELLRHTRTIPLTSVKRAVVDSTWDRKHTQKLKGIALDIDGAVIAIDGHSNANNDLKGEWILKVNQFLSDPSQATLAIHYGSTWPAFFTSAAVLLIFIGYARSRLRIIMDGNERILQIEHRIFRTTVQTFPLDQVIEAFIDERQARNGRDTLRGVALRIRDASPVILDGHSSVENNAKMQLVTTINAALEDVRNR